MHQERTNSLKQFIAGGGRNRYEEFFALNEVSFEVREGEAFGVIGHNGSGKSTLLKCMARSCARTPGSDRGQPEDVRPARTRRRLPSRVVRT